MMGASWFSGLLPVCGCPAQRHVTCPPQTGLAVVQGLSPVPLFSLNTALSYLPPSFPANPQQLLQSSQRVLTHVGALLSQNLWYLKQDLYKSHQQQCKLVAKGHGK